MFLVVTNSYQLMQDGDVRTPLGHEIRTPVRPERDLYIENCRLGRENIGKQ